MTDILNMLISNLGNDNVNKISNNINEDSSKTQNAITAALPLLLNALNKNSANSEGASSLQKALDRDHDGSIFDNISGFLGDPASGKGSGILKHVLGNKQSGVEDYISKSSGVSKSAAGGLLETLAPLLMGYLGKQNRSSSGGITNLLGSLTGEVNKNTNQSSSIINSLLDQDGDGSITDDLTKTGFSLLKRFFKK